MVITSNLGSGIRGTTVNGFVVSNSSITTNGNDAASDESGIFITNLTGTAAGGTNPTSITNSTISNNNEFEIQITNTSGTLTNLTMSGNTISSNGLPINGNATSPHGNLLNFLGTSTAVMTLTVTSGTFTGNWNPASPPATITATAISAVNQGTSHTVNVSGVTFTNNNAGVDCSSDPIATTFTCVVSNNNFQGSRAVAINSFHNGNAPYTRTFTGTFTNNTIGTVGVAGSGSGLGNGISVQNEGAISDARYLISGNQIHQVTSFPAVSVNVGLGGLATGGGTTNVTITNNTISNIGSRGIVVQDNQDPTLGPFPTVCANISGNSFSNIAGQAGNGEFMRVRRLNGTVRVTQATPTAAANSAELDDANGFNDPIRINISGTVLFGQTPCITP
jgi:parallel beta-helix repeat protein